MTNQELYKQAILDAKAVRETAMAAAKESLAEAFEPRIKEMLRLKLAEELEEGVDELEETKDEMEESTKVEETADVEEGKSDMEESTLDEILAELDALSEKEEKMEEAKDVLAASDGLKKVKDSIKQEAEGDDEKETETDDEAGDEEKDEAGEEAGEGVPVEPTDDTEVIEITVGDLKSIFRDVFAQLQGGEEAPVGDTGTDLETGAPESTEDEISLEEILASLEEDEKKMEEAAFVPGDQKAVAAGNPGKTAEKIDEKKDAELEEARKVIQAMRSELQEVNLLNAKLLYVNKLWKAKSLTESQKVKVLNAFDRATTVKEAENIFKTLSESLESSAKKSTIKESFGFASKAIGTAPAKPIVEVDSMVARWQQIAGIKK